MNRESHGIKPPDHLTEVEKFFWKPSGLDILKDLYSGYDAYSGLAELVFDRNPSIYQITAENPDKTE